MDGMKVILANAGLGRSESACSMSSAARSSASWGYGQSEGAGALDRASEFFRMLQKMFEASPNSELEALNSARSLAYEEDAELRQAASGEMPDEDEPNGESPVATSTTFPQSHPASAVAQGSAMLAQTLTLTPDVGAASQEEASMDDSPSSLLNGLMHSGGVGSSAWRRMETASAIENLPETGMACSALGVDRTENLNAVLTTDVGNGHAEPSVYESEHEGAVSRIAEGSGANCVGGNDHIQLAKGVQTGEALPGNRGDASGGLPGVAIASKAAGSNPRMDLRSLGQGASRVGHVNADSKAGLWNTMPTLGDMALINDIESALFISGASVTKKPAVPGLAGQMEGVGSEEGDGGPDKVLQRTQVWSNHSTDRSSRGGNAEAETANLAAGDGREATYATDGLQRLAPFLMGKNVEPVDGDHILDVATPVADTFGAALGADGIEMDGAEQLGEAVGEMPGNALDFVEAEAGDGGMPSDWNLQESRSGLYADGMADTASVSTQSGAARGTPYQDMARTPPSVSGAVKGVDPGDNCIMVEGTQLSDSLSQLEALSAEGLGREKARPSNANHEKARSVGAGVGGIYGGSDGVNLSDASVNRGAEVSRRVVPERNGELGVEVVSGESPPSARRRPSTVVGFELKAEGVEPGARPGADLGDTRIGSGGLETKSLELQADGNGHIGEAGTDRKNVPTDYGHGPEAVAGQKDYEPKNRSDSRSDGRSYPRHEVISERESEPAKFGSRRAADVDGMRMARGGLRASQGEMPIVTGQSDCLLSVNRKALTQEAGRSVMQQIAAHIEARRNRQSGEFRARLVPESLGEVQIRIRVHGRACTATIQVGNGEIGDYIEQHGTDLKVLLAQSGIDLADLSVSVGSHSASGDAGEWAQAQYAAAAFTGGGRRGRKEYDQIEPWLHDARARDAIVAQEVGRAAVSIGPGYGRIDYFA